MSHYDVNLALRNSWC